MRRWLSLGPLRLNVSAAFAPWLLIRACSDRRSGSRAAIALLGAQAAHVAQPDAGQATALAAGTVTLLIGRWRATDAPSLPLAFLVTVLAAAAWLRDDPLPAVEHVERILILATRKGPFLLVAVMVAGLALVLPFVVAREGRTRQATSVALLSYLVACFGVTFAGNFPVPIFGAGAAPVLGWYASLCVHAIAIRRTVPSSVP